MKTGKLIIWILIACLAIVVLIQGISLIRCEILTNKYHADFEFACESNPMLGEIENFKVLRCDGQTAEVYYIETGKAAAYVLTFEKIGGSWQEADWRCVWSGTGSASGVIWPYWWHFVYGGV